LFLLCQKLSKKGFFTKAVFLDTKAIAIGVRISG